MFALTAVHLSRKYMDSMNEEQKHLYYVARDFLDRGLHSCQQWWASQRPWYSPDMIIRGLGEILLAVVNANRSIPDRATDIKEAQRLILTNCLEIQNDIILNLK